MQFRDSIGNSTQTTNGMSALKSTGKALVDFFNAVGSSRGQDVSAKFDASFNEDPEMTLRALFWARDIRGGAGERETFRKLMAHLNKNNAELAQAVMHLIPEYGRWDDLFVFMKTDNQNQALELIKNGLSENNGLCAKWMPRKGVNFHKVRNYVGLSPKDYRKYISSMTNVVEQKMCAKEWNTIEFGKLPSIASARYQKAFAKNAADSYTAYKEALKAGTAKINAGAIFPYTVVTSFNKGEVEVAEKQWEALPNYFGDAEHKILPLIDVSGSMSQIVPGSKNLNVMDVAISIGLYIADKQKGAFQDVFLNFHSNPTIGILKGTVSQKEKQIRSSDWGGSTNIAAAYREILKFAKRNNIKQEDMPDYLMILSDMQFDTADRSWVKNPTAQEDIEAEFEKAGYKTPKIVYWNLATHNNVPVAHDKRGTAIVSGFSPSMLTAILSTVEFTPENVVAEKLSDERYDHVSKAYEEYLENSNTVVMKI